MRKLIPLVALPIMIIGCSSNQDPQPPPEVTVFSPPETHESNEAPRIEILLYEWHQDPLRGEDGAVEWNVRVKNNTDELVARVRLEFKSYDEEGNLITTDYAEVMDLTPGGIGEVEAFAEYSGEEKDAEIRIVP